MKFDRLRLVGFKSFVEPHDIAILPGLTGVVGPNGCGKSNLLEALRWAMGETSPKSMRGSGMEDVIFAGTLARPARNHAEVTLVLDNTARTAPAQYNDDDLIEITRRIERDAGSAYRINGRDALARDVQLLFADAATGARSHALVQQGQIGELINAKPEARRRILEEAAGISGLYTRRHDAELRLRAAEANIARVDDALAQFDEQLRGLKRQARQAIRYRNISEQLRGIEAMLLHVRWTQANEEAEAARIEFDAAGEAERDAAQAAAQSGSAQTRQHEALPALREAESAAAAKFTRLRHALQTLDQEEARALDLATRLRGQRATLEEDTARAQAMQSDAQERLSRLAEEEKTLQMTDKITPAARDAAAQAVEAAETRFEETRTACAERDARARDAARILREASEKTERLQAELAACEQELAAMREITGGGKARAQLHDRLAKVEAARHAAAAKLDACLAEAEAARAAHAKLTGEQAGLAGLFARPDDKDWPMLIDDMRVERGYENALGAALGDDLDASSDARAPTHWRDLPPLADAPPLPQGAAPLMQFVKAPPHMTRRLSQIGVVPRARGADLQKKLTRGQRIVSREGDVWRWDGYCSTSEALAASARRLSQRNRLTELAKELAKAEKRAATCDAALAEARTAAQAAQAEESKLRAAASETRARIEMHEQTQARLENELAALAAQSQAAKAEQAELAAQPDPQEKMAREQETLSTARQELTRLDSALARVVRIGEEEQSWRAQQERAESQIAELATRREKLNSELVAQEKLPNELVARREKIGVAVAEAETARVAAGDALACAERAVKQADMAVRQATDSLAQAREARARLEERHEGARNLIAAAAARIEEVLEVAPEKAADIAGVTEGDSLPDAAACERKLEKLRRERENLGGVNLRAEAEAGEIEARMACLQSERDELVQAINKLRHGIGQLNREGRTRMRAAFKNVNAHFERLFMQLFGGGTARLDMTADDPLAAGLEVIAHPPGKKPQAMSLLSGGEQALTALALIFAVFLTNPSPICVLDEVDAPLDDANVDRFCNLIREIANATETRFILITHHALTMARVDRLLGVTMQERGVSELIAVDLSIAERFAEKDEVVMQSRRVAEPS